MKNNKNKKKKNAVISVVLIVALLITGIFAFLWSSDTKVNKFTVGKVDIVLHEDDWYDEDGNVLNDENNNDIPDFAEDLVPGQEVPKAPYVENTGKNPAHVYIAVGIPVEHRDNILTGTGSYSGIGALNPAEIIVNAYGIQNNYANLTNSDDIWNAYVNNEGVVSMFGEPREVTDPAANVEFLQLLNLNETNWEEVILENVTSDGVDTNVYHSTNTENGMNYNFYVYKYNNGNNSAMLDVNEVTAALFTGVTLREDIGEEFIPPLTLDFYAPNEMVNNVSATADTITASSLDKANSILTTDVEEAHIYYINNYTKIASYEVQNGNTISEDTLIKYAEKVYEDGYLFIWKIMDIEDDTFTAVRTVEPDITISEPISLVAFYELYDEGTNGIVANYLSYQILEDNGRIYASLKGANLTEFEEIDTGIPDEPCTGINAPSKLILQYNSSTGKYLITNGYLETAEPGSQTSNTFINELDANSCPYLNFNNVTNGTILEIPVEQVDVVGNSNYTPENCSANALLSLAEWFCPPDSVKTMNYVGNINANGTNYSVLKGIKIPYSCTEFGPFTNGVGGLSNHPDLYDILYPSEYRITCIAEEKYPDMFIGYDGDMWSA